MSDISEKILEASNGGLDVILSLFPQAKPGRNFKIRQEKTASASLYKHSSGTWLVTDYGDDSKPMNAILLYAKEGGMSYRDAVMQLAEQYGIISQSNILKPDIRKLKPTEVDYLDQFSDSGFFFQFKTEFTEAELDVLGPLVTQEICTRYKLFSVDFYAKKKDNEIVQISSTEHFPIFAFVNKDKDGKEWMKVLQPKSQDKAYRFFHIGGRPKNHVFGLEYIQKQFAAIQPSDENMDEESDSQPKETKLERIVLASGDRDALNLAGAGELVIWLNSETATFDTALYSKLSLMAKKIVNVPDIDKTGREQGADLALTYMNIFTAWLPDELSQSKDFRGNSKKDFLDFCNQLRHNTWNLKNQIRLLLDNAKSCQFWDVRYTKNGVNYEFNNVNAYYFLSLCGFHRMVNPENQEDYLFVRAKEHMVFRVNYLQVKDFVNNFMAKKQLNLGERIITNSLRNMIYNSNKMSESSLINLPTIAPNFTDYGRNHQLFFFRKQIWKINKNTISKIDSSKIDRSTWIDDMIEIKIRKMYGFKMDDRKLNIEDRYFTIWKDKEGDWDIRIDNPDCEFLNYLINTSRVFWQKENFALVDKSEDDKLKYWEENRFNIAGAGLTADEILEQKLHLINKIFVYGYLLHRYKDPNKAWLVWLMDNEIVDDDESHGRTGKSLFSNSLRVFMNTEVREARNRKLFENGFLYDGVTEYTDYLLFDDANKYFDVGQIYTKITGDFNVNPKNNKPYVIPFSESPKMAVSTNYAIRDTSSSTTDRLLLGVFSNYYHAETKELERRTPHDDFGHLFFNDWNDTQWNRFINFSAQALQFYFSVNEKLSAPDQNVMKRNSLTIMGVAFQNWADLYLPEFINHQIDEDKFFNKLEAYENMKEQERSLSSSSAKDFNRKLEHWCIYNDVILDPKEKCTTKDRRIFMWVDGKSVQHHFLLKTTPEEDEGTMNKPIAKEDDWLNDELDDLKL